jgi:hypothetical protein
MWILNPACQVYGCTKARHHLATPLILLTEPDHDGVEEQSGRMELNGTCHPGLGGYSGILIGKDPRDEGYQVGCAYSSKSDDCSGNFNPIHLTFSCECHPTFHVRL